MTIIENANNRIVRCKRDLDGFKIEILTKRNDDWTFKSVFIYEAELHKMLEIREVNTL